MVVKNKFEEKLKERYERWRVKEEQLEQDNEEDESIMATAASNALKRKLSTQNQEKAGGFKKSSAFDPKTKDKEGREIQAAKDKDRDHPSATSSFEHHQPPSTPGLHSSFVPAGHYNNPFAAKMASPQFPRQVKKNLFNFPLLLPLLTDALDVPLPPPQPRQPDDPNSHQRTVFVAGLREGVTEHDIAPAFQEFGDIESVRIPMGKP